MPARLQATDNNRSIVLDKPILFVGRHPDCDVVINSSRKVSRKHCCLAEINGQYVVRDLGSTNGVQINGRRVIGIEQLEHGDELTIGDCVYTFHNGIIVTIGNRTEQDEKLQESAIPAPLNESPTPIPEIPAPAAENFRSPPQMQQEQDEYDIYPGERGVYRPNHPTSRRKHNSDSHLELAID